MKRITQFLFLLVVLAFATYSCTSEYRGYDKTESGVYYKFHEKNDGTKIRPGDEITFHLKYSINDSVIFNTKESSYPNKQVVLESQYLGDIYECLTLMSVGDSANFILEADSFYLVTIGYPKLPEKLVPNSKLLANVKILSLKSKEELEIEKMRYLAELRAKEAEKIEELKEKRKATKEFIENSNIFYVPINKGSGRLPNPTDFISVEYIIRDLKNNVVFRSDRFEGGMSFECMGENFETEGFNLIISKMRKGQKAGFVVPSKFAFGEEGIKGKINPYSPLFYTIEILNIQTKENFIAAKEKKNAGFINAENEKISKYINDNNISVMPRESGLYFIELVEGDGEFAKKGNNVKVHYTLYNLDGKKIDSSIDRGIPFAFKVEKGQVIDGWIEAITLMKIGGKATLILPSKVAYKDKKRSKDILPYTPLRFEVELLEIVK